MRQIRLFGRIAIAIVIGCVSIATTLAQSDEDATNSFDLAAAEYAEDNDVSIEEARYRLKLQDPAGELNGQLESNEEETFAGAWLQHQPEFKVIVQLTNGSESTVEPYIEGGPLEDLVEIRSASLSLAELRTLQNDTIETARTFDVPFESGLDVKEQRVELYVVERERFEEAAQQADYKFPDRVDIIPVEQLSIDEIDAYAGTAINNLNCTTGFTVEDQHGTLGITTAGHCGDPGDPIDYFGHILPQEDEWDTTVYDLAWHPLTSDFTVRSWMRTSST
ncbi:MAG: hypothetical protein ACOC9Y_10755, partial [Chloroflexota bacterium]